MSQDHAKIEARHWNNIINLLVEDQQLGDVNIEERNDNDEINIEDRRQ